MQQFSSLQTNLNEIPQDWKVVNLQEIATINPESIAKDYPYNEIEYIDIGSIENYQITKYERFSLNKRPSRAQRIVRRNDIIVSTVRPYLHGFAKIIDSKTGLVCSTGFAVLRCHDSQDADFIFNFIKSEYFESQLNVKMTGLAYPAVTSKIVGNTLLGYPKNKVEIEKIGNILSTLDELIQKINRIIEQTQRLKKGLMQKLLTKGIGHKKFRRMKMGFKYMMEEYPEEWKILLLKDLSKIERGKFTHRPRDDPDFYGGKYPFIQTGDVERSDGYIKTFSQTLNEKGLYVSKIFPSGIIALTIAATIGSVAITTFPVCFPDSVVGITPSNIDLTFLFYFLQTRKRFLEISATVSAQPNINLETLKPMLIPVPPIDEQHRIASILSNIDSMISKLSNSKYEMKRLKWGLMQNLLTGKIRVKL
jgi:type I restriction enzyme S subunit